MADKKTTEVEAIVRRQKELKHEVIEREEEQGMLWRRFDELADELGGEGQSFKAVSIEAAWKLHRIRVEPSPRINVPQLRAALTDEQWKLVTKPAERQFDVSLLEKAVAGGKITAETVGAVTETPAPSFQHRNDVASTNELKEAKGL